MKEKQWSTLYKKASNGTMHYWKIEVAGNYINSEHGKVNGSPIRTEDIVRKGKNKGKANETTPEQQAVLKADSSFLKKKKGGYVESQEDAESGKVDTIIQGGIVPMTAKVYSEKDILEFPVAVQPKLDGHRATLIVKDGKASLWSRTRKPITSCPHILKEAESLCSNNYKLDGELYNHLYREKFEELTSLIKRQEPSKWHEAIQFHVYDIPDAESPFSHRLEGLQSLASDQRQITSIDPDDWAIQPVETLMISDLEGVKVAYKYFMEKGYEGAMVRRPNSLYEHKRSKGLLKFKQFEDAEFKVIGKNEGNGKLAGHVGSFIFQMEDGTTFKAKMKGAQSILKHAWNNFEEYDQKIMTVQFQGRTNGNKPRFPVALRLREDL